MSGFRLDAGGRVDRSIAVNFTFDDVAYRGMAGDTLPALGSRLYRVDAPAQATRLKVFGTNASSVSLRLEQGTLPQASGTAHWISSGANPSLNQALVSGSSSWPWQTANSYYLLITNTTGSAQPFTVRFDGRNAATEDEDNDGLPDAWELTYWPSIYSYNDVSDPDNDGVSNWNEFLNGTSPGVADVFMLAQPMIQPGVFQAMFLGPTNGRYRVEFRTNLTTGAWTPLRTFTNAAGATWISDTNAGVNRARFYRAVGAAQ